MRASQTVTGGIKEMANDVSKSLTNITQNAGASPYALMTCRYK